MKCFLVAAIFTMMQWAAVDLIAQDDGTADFKGLILKKFDADRDGALAGLEKFGAVKFLKNVDGNGDEPLAWNVEVAWGVAADTELALRIEGSEEMAGMPELQYGICVSKGIGENISLSLEYLHGEFDTFNAPLDTRELVTAQLALEF
jgi:hypothetical protein